MKLSGEMVTVLVAVGLAMVVGHELFPRVEETIKPIPHIVTEYDTVHTIVTVAGPKVVTTDTVNIIQKVTLHDTVQVYLGADTTKRQNIWPVLSVTIGKSRGDTSHTTTFSLRSGKTVESELFTPGPLKSLWADSTGTPRMDFYDPPPPFHTSSLTKGLWAVIGFGACWASERVH